MNIYYQNRKKVNISKIHDNIIAIHQSPLSKSVFPNQQKALKISCLNCSYFGKNNENTKKKFNNFSQNVNQLNSLQQFKNKNFLVMNGMQSIIKEEMDEENFQEDDKESKKAPFELNKKKKKKLVDKSVKIDIKSHYENPDYNGFYRDPIKFKLYIYI